MQWYYAVDGQQYGPVEEQEICSLAREGKLRPTDLVWNPSMGAQWAKVSAVPELSAGAEVRDPVDVGPRGQTPNADLMAQGRAALSGQWGLAVAVVLVYLAIGMAVQIIPFAGALAGFFISGPLIVGLYAFFLNVGRQADAPFSTLFSGFSQFLTSFLANLLIGIFVLLWCLPGLVLATALFWSQFKLLLMSAGAPQPHPDFRPLVGFVVLVLLAAGIPATIAQLRYAMTYFIVVENPGVGPLEAIRRSKDMMRGNMWKLFCLGLRFIGWALLCIPTCGLGVLWLMPYVLASTARFYDDVRS